MKVNDLVDVLGTEEAVQMFFGLKNTSHLNKWKKSGVPLGRQYEFEARSGGRLRVKRSERQLRMDALLLEAAGKTGGAE